MNNGIYNIRGDEYNTVALRIHNFRNDHPDWSIVTKIIQNDDAVIVNAEIRDESGRVLATGHAEERRGSNNINKTNAIENCETSAVGRALAFLDYGGKNIASAEEMQRVEEPAHKANVDVIKTIQELAEEKGVSLDRITNRYEVSDIHALDADQAQNAIKRLKKIDAAG